MPRLILPLSEEPSAEAFAAYDAAQAVEAELFDAKAYAESPAEHLRVIHRIAQARALDAFAEPWRSKIAEVIAALLDLADEFEATIAGEGYDPDHCTCAALDRARAIITRARS